MSGEYIYYDDSEVEALLERRYRELMAQAQRQEAERRKREEEEKRQEILRMILTPEARERLSNIKLVRPEIAKVVEDRLIALALQGKITEPITDEELKNILAEIYERTRRDFRINIREK